MTDGVTGEGRILAAKVIDDSINFTLEIWAYGKLTDDEINRTAATYLRSKNRPRSLKNKTIKLMSLLGR